MADNSVSEKDTPVNTQPKNEFKDTKASDAEQSLAEGSENRELKRKLKSRHLQMIAIGTSRLMPMPGTDTNSI